MSERDFGSMEDCEFDALLENSIADTPPEEIIQEVTPWRKAMNRVLVGMALCGITFNFLNLDVILPTIGVILSVLGFRTLHRENKWFFGCYVLTLLRSIYLFGSLILGATIYYPVNAAGINSILNITNLAVIFLSQIFLWRGFLDVQEKAKLTAHASGAVGMLIWYGVMCILAIVQYQGLVLPLILLLAYIQLLRNLFKLSKELDEAGYTIRPYTVRISDGHLTLLMTTVLIVGLVCSFALGGSYQMTWTTQTTTKHSDVTAVQDYLLSIGFPEEVLQDLADEDILACKDAIRIVVDETDEALNEGRSVTDRTATGYYTYQVFDEKPLHITGVAVELAGEREQWKIIHHFRFADSVKFYGTESIQLWPTYRDLDGWSKASDVTGQILCTKNGKRVTAPYYSLHDESYTTNSIIWGNTAENATFAEFSMPNKASNRSGYIAYTVKEMQDGWIINSWVNYTHQTSWLQYPVLTAKQKRMADGFNRDGAFYTIQDALQFYPNDDPPTPFS